MIGIDAVLLGLSARDKADLVAFMETLTSMEPGCRGRPRVDRLDRAGQRRRHHDLIWRLPRSRGTVTRPRDEIDSPNLR
jgi:hypothetical protein